MKDPVNLLDENRGVKRERLDNGIQYSKFQDEFLIQWAEWDDNQFYHTFDTRLSLHITNGIPGL